MEHLQRVWLASRDTWFRPPFWDLLMLQLLRPDSSSLPFFTRLFTSNTPWYFLDFASGEKNTHISKYWSSSWSNLGRWMCKSQYLLLCKYYQKRNKCLLALQKRKWNPGEKYPEIFEITGGFNKISTSVMVMDLTRILCFCGGVSEFTLNVLKSRGRIPPTGPSFVHMFIFFLLRGNH